jgi:diguanylate cyclase (GGDEF)-like protein
LALFFFGSIALAIFFDTSRSMVDRQLEVSSAYCGQIAQRAYDWIEERRMDIRYLAIELEDEGVSALRAPSAYMRLSAFMEVANGAHGVVVVDAHGVVIASSAGAGLVGKNLSEMDYVHAALRGRGYFGLEPGSPLSGEPVFAIAEVLRIAGIDQGAVVGFLPLAGLSRIVESSSIDDFGRVFLVDAKGRKLPSLSGRGEDFTNKPVSPGAPSPAVVPVSLLNAGKGAAEYRSPDGEWMIGAYRWLTDPPLGLLVEVSLATALKQLRSLIDFMIATAAIMLAILVVLATILSTIMVKPIAALLEEAEALRLGRVGTAVKIKTGTELDQLVEMFNSMSTAVREREQRLKESAARDALTRLYNRGRLEEFLELELRRRRRADEAVSFVMLDIDHFKQINDRYGHLAGDQVLRGIADLLAQTVRGGDVAARYGGEEFAVILDAKSEEEVAAFCERLRSLVEATVFSEGGEDISVTISLGWTRCPARGSENPDIIRLADRALYDAKNAGRNRVKGSSV